MSNLFRAVYGFQAVRIPFFCAFVFVSVSWAYGQQDRSEASLKPTVEQLEFFEREIRPLLVEHCYECHSGKSSRLKAGLLLDSRQGMLKGGDSGPAITGFNPDESLLIQAVRYETFEMPPKGKLQTKDIDLLTKWVAIGAPWPEEKESSDGPAREVFDWQKRKASHWAWQPITVPPLPVVIKSDWPKSAMDDFILAGLEKSELKPAGPADKYTLVRRLSFDLVGLPPSPDQVQDFVKNESKQADRLTDRHTDRNTY